MANTPDRQDQSIRDAVGATVRQRSGFLLPQQSTSFGQQRSQPACRKKYTAFLRGWKQLGDMVVREGYDPTGCSEIATGVSSRSRKQPQS